jgi:hypothetical protein
LKRKIHGDDALANAGERTYNSPWNIAADFKVDMSFRPAEIATMLIQYEDDHHTGMNITEISDEIYKYTSGYPFLVSKICKIIDEQLNKNWSLTGVRSAVKLLLPEANTLFDDLKKNLENNKELYNLIFSIIIGGEEIPFAFGPPEIELGCIFGIIIDKDGKIAVSNEIFELLITNYFTTKIAISNISKGLVLREDIIRNGKFDMELCLKKFANHYYELYSEQELTFLERHGRILFLTYLRPLINGQGFYHIETQTRNVRRMDIVVDYGSQQFILELKLWNGDKKHEDAYAQLCGYLDDKGMDTGYLLTFDFRKGVKKERRAKWVEYGGKRIFDVMV